MTDSTDKIRQLSEKVEELAKKEAGIFNEIILLRKELAEIKSLEKSEVHTIKEQVDISRPEPYEVEKIPEYQEIEKPNILNRRKFSFDDNNDDEERKSNLEKFIGENLINKIGIAITIIGVGIGAKYTIDHDLISPSVRIMLGYLMGFLLLGFGIKLKKEYTNYSAVLVSGAMAIQYFITYFAYSYYLLIPLALAFCLMFVITVCAVYAALTYNKQLIAHIGLVGAYAVPFLLSNDSGNVVILFSYIAFINLGILYISFKKYWKSVYYSSFVISWLILLTWYSSKYQTDEHLTLTLLFISIFFGTFYTIFLFYKLIKKEIFENDDILLLLANSFVFYGIGYDIFFDLKTEPHYMGLFTVCNAIVHAVIGVLIFKQKMSDRNLFYFVAGLALVFITIAVPVQLDGNWVTLLWAGEAALLFWIGRTKRSFFYEKISYVLMILAFISIIHDWSVLYGNYTIDLPESRITPLYNINFLTSLLFVSMIGFINYLNFNPRYHSPIFAKYGIYKLIYLAIPLILLISVYFSFKMEISNYFQQLYIDSCKTIDSKGQIFLLNTFNQDILRFKDIWIINYFLFFLSALALLNIMKFKSRELGIFTFIVSIFAVVLFLLYAVILMSQLRDSYLNRNSGEYFHPDIINVGIRYISFAFLALLLSVSYISIKGDYMKGHEEFIVGELEIMYDILLYITILWVASSELINWMDIAGSSQSDKLGLSILWGVYSLLIIAIGIWKKKKYLRIGAIGLFGVTLIKLFFYDISHLDTISKTIVFVSLGVLLLIISFLYNKYKLIISEEIDNNIQNQPQNNAR